MKCKLLRYSSPWERSSRWGACLRAGLLLLPLQQAGGQLGSAKQMILRTCKAGWLSGAGRHPQASAERIIPGAICIDIGVNSRACGGAPVSLEEAEMPLHLLLLILDPGESSWGKQAALCHCNTGKTPGRT